VRTEGKTFKVAGRAHGVGSVAFCGHIRRHGVCHVTPADLAQGHGLCVYGAHPFLPRLLASGGARHVRPYPETPEGLANIYMRTTLPSALQNYLHTTIAVQVSTL
jgi:hypothetical protein